MQCNKCGTEIPENANFCSACGASAVPTEEPQTAKTYLLNSKKPISGLKRKHVITAVAILGVLIAGIVLFVNLALPKLESNAEINALEKQIEKQKYNAAYQLYEEFDSENRTKANKWLREYIDSVEEDYYEGKLDYPTATDILSELLPFEAVSSKISKAGENIHLDNQSTMAFEKAKDYAEDKKWQDAYKALQNIHIKYRLYDDVADLRTECLENYRKDVLDQISDFAKSEKIDKLIAARDNALKIIPDDKEIIQTSQKHLDTFVKNTLANAAALAEKKDYDGAMELLQYAADMYDHEDLWEALKGYGYDAAKAHCEALVAKNDLLGAVKYAKGLADADSQYKALLDKYAKSLVENTLLKAKTLADKRDFEKAISTITIVQEVYNCSELQSAVKAYTDYLPIRLIDCYSIESSDSWRSNRLQEGDWVDSLGKKHTDSLHISSCGGGGSDDVEYIVYNTDSKYVTFSGTLAYTQGSDYEEALVLKFYVDSKLVYASAPIDKTSQPITFSIDITGGRLLRIEFVATDNDYSTYGSCIIDATLS